MNQKAAKRIRREFRIAYGSDIGQGNVIRAARTAFRHRSYVTHKEGRKIVSTGRLLPNGGAERVLMHWRTIKLHPECPRALYQQMKAAA